MGTRSHQPAVRGGAGRLRPGDFGLRHLRLPCRRVRAARAPRAGAGRWMVARILEHPDLGTAHLAAHPRRARAVQPVRLQPLDPGRGMVKRDGRVHLKPAGDPISPLNFLRAALNPDAYHGTDRRPPFFEGWCLAGRPDAAAPLRRHPGRVQSRDRGWRCFVQVLDGRPAASRYPAEAFRSARGRFEIAVGPSRFSAEGLSLDGGPEGTLRGSVLQRAEPLAGYPDRRGSWAGTPAPTHADLSRRGHWTPHPRSAGGGGQRVDFTGGDGYIEGLGRSFPSGWVWMPWHRAARHQPDGSIAPSLAGAQHRRVYHRAAARGGCTASPPTWAPRWSGRRCARSPDALDPARP